MNFGWFKEGLTLFHERLDAKIPGCYWGAENMEVISCALDRKFTSTRVPHWLVKVKLTLYYVLSTLKCSPVLNSGEIKIVGIIHSITCEIPLEGVLICESPLYSGAGQL
jgi:hypothetical protein